MMIATTKRFVCATLLVVGIVTSQAHSALAIAPPCEQPIVVDNVARPGVISISRRDLTAETMRVLWSLATQDPEVSTQLFGTIIAADQNWLGSCAYPGIGIGAGAGSTELERTVWVWVWADEVNLTRARESLLTFLSDTSSAASSQAWSANFGADADDVSVVAQPLGDESIVAVAKHGVGASGTISVRRYSTTGQQHWRVSLAEDEKRASYGSAFYVSSLLPSGSAIFAGAVEKQTHDLELLSVSRFGEIKKIVKPDARGDEFARAIAVCGDGSVYAGGLSQNGATTDVFVSRFDSALRHSWTQRFGGARNDQLFALSCADSGDARAFAWADGQILGVGDESLLNFYFASFRKDSGAIDVALADSDFGALSPQSGAFARDGSAYVVGEMNVMRPVSSCSDWALGASFVSRYSAQGELLWRAEIPCGNMNRKVAVTDAGDIYVAGSAFARSVAGQKKLGGSDSLLHRYSASGERLWTKQFGTAGDDIVSSLAISLRGSVVVGAYGHANASWDASVDAGVSAPVAPVAVTTTTSTTTTTTAITPSAAPVAAMTQRYAPQSVAVTSTTAAAAVTTTTVAPVPARAKVCKVKWRKLRVKNKIKKVRKVICG